MLIKLTKHELKGSGNVTLCLGTLLFVTILIANNLISIKNMAKTILTIPFIENSPMLILVALASILLVVISSRIMWREFESEKIYLLLTTPQSVQAIFGAKLLALMPIWLVWLANMILISIIFTPDTIWSLADFHIYSVFQFLMWTLLGTLLFYALVVVSFFACVLTKTVLASRWYRSLIAGIVVLISLPTIFLWFFFNLLLSYIASIKPEETLPVGQIGQVYLSLTGEIITLILSLVFIIIVLFLSSTYLLEKKINILK